MKIEDLNLSALKYFLDAVKLESITLSAQKNNVSRPAVSQAIARLEQWYGKVLLTHEKRRFELTGDGKKFYRLAAQNFENLKEGFLQSVAQNQSLKMGCSASLIDLVFPQIKGFIGQSSMPVIKIGSTSQLTELLMKNQIHMAFFIPTNKDPDLKTFDFHSGNFELRSKSGQISEPFIVTESRPETEDFERYARKKRINFEHLIVVESWTVAQQLAEKMGGTCLVPDSISKGTLKPVSIKGWAFKYNVQVAIRSESVLSDLESELFQSLKV